MDEFVTPPKAEAFSRLSLTHLSIRSLGFTVGLILALTATNSFIALHLHCQGECQLADEDLPLLRRQSPAQGPQFALEPDPFQVDHVAADGRLQAVDSGDGVAEVVGGFHGSHFPRPTPHNRTQL